MISDRTYTPKSVSELADKFASLASGAPNYKGPHGNDLPPELPFAVARAAVNNVPGLNATIRAYLNARIDENWERLQTGEIGNLELSFGELSHFLRSRRYRQFRELKIDRNNATPLDL